MSLQQALRQIPSVNRLEKLRRTLAANRWAVANLYLDPSFKATNSEKLNLLASRQAFSRRKMNSPDFWEGDNMSKVHVIYQDYAKLNEVQHEPFFFSRDHFRKHDWQPKSIGVLYRLLKEYRLDPYWQPFETVDPCTGIINYDAPLGSPERYIDGPRMFEANGIVNFKGNFENFSFGFDYFTNVPEIIQKLREAIAWNLANRERLN